MVRPLSWSGKDQFEYYSSSRGAQDRQPSLSRRSSLSLTLLERPTSSFAPLETIAGSPFIEYPSPIITYAPNSPTSSNGSRSSNPLPPGTPSKSRLRGHVGVQMDLNGEVSVSGHSPSFRFRNRRLMERLLTFALAAGLVWSFLSRGSDGMSFTGRRLRQWKHPRPLRFSTAQTSFRANLRDDRGYVTSFPYGGFTNQIIEMFKLVHLAHRLNRVAILPELKAVHSEGGDILFSEVFDLVAFSDNANVSAIEWKDIKHHDTPGTEREKLSCWGWRDPRPLARYNVHTDFWPYPGQLTVPSSIESSMTFPAIEVLVSQPQTKWLTAKSKEYFGSVEKAPAFPDSQLLCFENLFYVPSLKFVQGAVDRTFSIEELSPQDPVWAEVGRHLHFSAKANKIADELLSALLGSPKRPFIAVHIRQGDFVALGRVGKSGGIGGYVSAVELIQEELTERMKPSLLSLRSAAKPLPVVFASDSQDPSYIARLEDLGWLYIDHKEFATVTRFGGWYPGLLDSLILSRSVGFVGTKMSTFSYVAARRVESWNDGVSRIVG